MVFIYSIFFFLTFAFGIFVGLELPFISDKLGKQIIREYKEIPINNTNNIQNLTPDIINEWQNGSIEGDIDE